MSNEVIESRSEVGVTIGLMETIATAARVLRDRDLSPAPVVEALVDLRGNEDVSHLMRL